MARSSDCSDGALSISVWARESVTSLVNLDDRQRTKEARCTADVCVVVEQYGALQVSIATHVCMPPHTDATLKHSIVANSRLMTKPPLPIDYCIIFDHRAVLNSHMPSDGRPPKNGSIFSDEHRRFDLRRQRDKATTVGVPRADFTAFRV